MIAILSGIFGLIAAITELIGGQAGGYAFASLVAVSTLVTTAIPSTAKLIQIVHISNPCLLD